MTDKLDFKNLKLYTGSVTRKGNMCEQYKHYMEHDCGGVAFYLKEPLAYGEVLMASMVIKTDGTYPDVNEIICCGSCGENVYSLKELS